MTNENPEDFQPTPEISPEPIAEPLAESAGAPGPSHLGTRESPTSQPVAEPIAESTGAPDPSHLGTRETLPPEPVAEPLAAEPAEPDEPEESFADLLNDFERSHSHKSEQPGQRQLQGVVISLSADQVFLDIGYKTEG